MSGSKMVVTRARAVEEAVTHVLLLTVKVKHPKTKRLAALVVAQLHA